MNLFWTNVWSIVVGLIIFFLIVAVILAIIGAIFGENVKKNFQNFTGNMGFTPPVAPTGTFNGGGYGYAR